MLYHSQPYMARLDVEERRSLAATHSNIGWHPETRDELHIPNIDRYAGTYVLGIQGCLHPSTPIFDPVDGTMFTVFERYTKGESFNVLALDGQNVVIAQAQAPLRYTKAPMYELSNGFTSIKVTGHHRIWNGSQYVECDVLYGLQGVLGVPLPTIADSELSRLQLRAKPSVETYTPDPYCPLSMYSNPSLYGITKIKDEIYYDFHVPKYENYYACGLFHHNSGKSGLLQNMIAADMQAGHAVIVIDPHGDLVKDCLNHIPTNRLADTYLLDMEDTNFPFGCNIFSTGRLTDDLEVTQAVERLMHIFEVLWPDVLSQQNLPRYVRAAALTFLANPGSTLVDMHSFLQDGTVRARMLQNVSDPTVRNFWHTQYDSLSPHEQYRRVQPLIGRLEALFMGRSLVRNIVGQRRNTISFRKTIEAKRIVFIKLPTKTVAQDARLIGTILLSQISGAIFSFANVPKAQRPGVSLYVDEFAHFATSDFNELFSEGRKFGLRLTIAHQYRNQLPSFLQTSTMSARTMICFQLTPDDGREMSHVFPSTETTIKPEDITEHPSRELLARTPEVESIQAFVELYLRPLQGHKRGAGRVEIEMRGSAPSLFEVMHGERSDNPKVADPTPYLDALLHQVMAKGDPDLDIPPEIVRGFANCGGGFFKKARRLHHGSRQLTPRVAYPSGLIIRRADGSYEPFRPPEDQTERMYYFICCLRLVMRYLAENPIGKATSTSPTDIGRMLTLLPKRAAFVRSGDTVGVIYTHDTAPALPQQEFFDRAVAILNHTRDVYCHPKAEVERLFMQPGGNKPPDDPPVSRWEEIE